MLNPFDTNAYRRFLYGSCDNHKPIPQSLIDRHNFAYSQAHGHFMQSRLDPQTLICIYLGWRDTAEGKAFLSEMNGTPKAPPVELGDDVEDKDAQAKSDLQDRYPRGTAVDVAIPGQAEYSGKIRAIGGGRMAGHLQVTPDVKVDKEYSWVDAKHVYRRDAKPLAVG